MHMFSLGKGQRQIGPQSYPQPGGRLPLPVCTYTREGAEPAQQCGSNSSGPNSASHNDTYTKEKMKPAQKCSPKPSGPSHNSNRSATTIVLSRIPNSHLALSLAPLIPALSPDQCTQREYVTHEHFKSSTPNKPLGICRLHSDAFTQGHGFKIRIGNYFP